MTESGRELKKNLLGESSIMKIVTAMCGETEHQRFRNHEVY